MLHLKGVSILRQQLVDIALHMPVEDRCECCGQICMRFHALEFAGVHQRSSQRYHAVQRER